MRLLNTTTLQFEEVPESDLELEENQYAILTHRWGRDEDEVTYQEILSSVDVSAKKGFTKIKEFCKIASSENCRYGWVDTCCINKGNSAELAEAINSMYMWYKQSKVCVAYLGDVVRHKYFTKSEWFDRGWTLQELIAPKVVLFFDQTWDFIGTKTDFLADLSRRTKIPDEVLSHAIKPSACSVAQRMSWAANRITKRIEDRAYSLMGLFDVHMPMIYGERENAFLRLQQNILGKYKDESLFAWAMERSGDATKTYSGLYAPSPSVYRNCDTIVPTPGSSGMSDMNGELSLSTEILPYTPGTYRAMLHCTDRALPNWRIGIMVARWDDSSNAGFVRVMRPNHSSKRLFPISHQRVETTIRVPINTDEPKETPLPVYCGFWLRTLEPPGFMESQITILSNCRVSEPNFVSQDYLMQGNTGIVRITPKNSSDRFKWSQIRWIKLGFSTDFKPILWLANDSQSNRLDESFKLALEAPQSMRDLKIKEAMKDDLLENCQGELIQQLHYEWPEGRLVLRLPEKVPETRLQVFTINNLNLRVSIQLQPFNSSSLCASESAKRLRLPVTPMMVWVVDVQAIGRKQESPSASEERVRLQTREREDCCVNGCLWSCCWPVACALCLCGSEESKDSLYPAKAATRRRIERNQRGKETAKAVYSRGAHTRLPVLENPLAFEDPAGDERRGHFSLRDRGSF